MTMAVQIPTWGSIGVIILTIVIILGIAICISHFKKQTAQEIIDEIN